MMAKLAEVKEYLFDNPSELAQIVAELNSWNNCLEHLEVMTFDEEFFNTYFDNAMEAVRAWHFGGDNSWNDDYIRFNGYGNLETLSEYDYEQELKESIDEIVDLMIDNQRHLYLSDELEELLNEDEDEDDEDEDEQEDDD